MKVFGITGGVGSGKSTVAHFMEQEYNAKLLIADDIGYQLSLRGQPCFDKIVHLFSKEYGDAVLDGQGQLNRSRIAQIVFERKDYLNKMNEIIHPAVKEAIRQKLEAFRKAGEHLVLIESAIIIGAGYEDICDDFILVTVPYEVRRQRLMEGRGYSREKIRDILNNQMPEEEMKKYCRYVLRNDGGVEEIRKQVDFLLSDMI